MAQNDDNRPQINVPAIFAVITALLEDAHEIAVRGQGSKLERTHYLEVTTELEMTLDQIWLNLEVVRRRLE